MRYQSLIVNLHAHHVPAEGAVEALVLLEAVLQARQVGREHVRATGTLRQKLTNLFISCDCFRMTGNSAAHREKYAILKQSPETLCFVICG